MQLSTLSVRHPNMKDSSGQTPKFRYSNGFPQSLQTRQAMPLHTSLVMPESAVLRKCTCLQNKEDFRPVHRSMECPVMRKGSHTYIHTANAQGHYAWDWQSSGGGVWLNCKLWNSDRTFGLPDATTQNSPQKCFHACEYLLVITALWTTDAIVKKV